MNLEIDMAGPLRAGERHRLARVIHYPGGPDYIAELMIAAYNLGKEHAHEPETLRSSNEATQTQPDLFDVGLFRLHGTTQLPF